MENNNRENTEKLQKIIANAGVCSRRKAEELLAAGLVTVNGVCAALGDRADGDTDEIRVEGKPLHKAEALYYIMLNKPRGYVCTASDEQGRKTVTELTADVGVRLYPVGRLDLYSEGLLLLTNDGDFAYKLTHPKHNIYKEYRVSVAGDTDSNPVECLSKPLDIDGHTIAPAIVKLLRNEEGGFLLSIQIREGRNRQIRKMCEACGYRVKNLKRIAVGPVTLGYLPTGQWRNLTEEEREALWKS